jgi:predicted regulator of Ras-like GTPase activity (Roadblock/LC7/MglB family)
VLSSCERIETMTTSTPANSSSASLDWLLTELTGKLPGVKHAVALSADGLLLAHAGDMSREDGEHLAAMASTFQGLARSAGRHYDGGNVRQTVVELDKLILFVTAAGQSACLALVADHDTNMGVVAYETNLLVQQVGTFLTARARSPLTQPDPRP